MEFESEEGVEAIDQSAPAGGSEEESAASQTEETDYKALYEEEVEKSEQWKEAALKNKRLAKEARGTTETSANETEDERVTRLASAVSTRVVATVTEDSLLKSKVSNPEERKLIKFYLENKLKRTGTSEEALEADIDTAIILARGKKAIIDNAEIKRTLANDSRVAATAGSSADRGVDRKPYEWTSEQEAILEKRWKSIPPTYRGDLESFKKNAWANRSKTNVA